jgi:hypothetical protein
MFRDEGTRPSIEFKEHMRARVQRTPTSLIVAALPFLITARLALIAHHYYVRSRCKTLVRQIDPTSDLRSIANVSSEQDVAA